LLVRHLRIAGRYHNPPYRQALEPARKAEQEIGEGRYRGPLHGLPYAPKDLIATKGIRTNGSQKNFLDLAKPVALARTGAFLDMSQNESDSDSRYNLWRLIILFASHAKS
jgi:hypothetical protein